MNNYLVAGWLALAVMATIFFSWFEMPLVLFFSIRKYGILKRLAIALAGGVAWLILSGALFWLLHLFVNRNPD